MLLNAIIEKDKNGYFAYIPELEGCVSEADSYEEVIANIKEAAQLYLESLKSDEIQHIISKRTLIMPIEVVNA